MHIAIECSTWVNPRGYGRFTREMTRALLRATTPHTFELVVDSGGARATDLPDAPVRVVRTSQAVTQAAGADGSRSPMDMLRMAQQLSRGFDLVFFPTSYSFVPVLPGPKVASVIHDALPETLEDVIKGARARFMWDLKTRAVCWRSDLIATVSRASDASIRRHLPVSNRPVAVLTEGAASVFSPRPLPDDDEEVGRVVPPAAPFILYVGGLSPHKRVPDLIRAFGELARESRHDRLRLVLVGPGELDSFTSDGDGVRAALESIGPVRDRVVRPGFVSDRALAAIYRRASCAVLPSLDEGFGLPAIEAMASGTPLVVRTNNALQELCGDAACYADDAGSLAKAIGLLLDDDGAAQRLRRLGPQRAALFSWDEGARRLLSALDALPRH